MRTMRYFEIIMDFSEPDSERKFLDAVKKAISLADKKREEEREFLKGVVLAYHAMLYAIKEDYINALFTGLKAYNILKKFKHIPDSYLALGIYNYGASIVQKYTGKLVFKGDRREKGMKEVEKAAEEGIWVRVLAIDALIEIYLREKMYSQAIKWAKRLYNEYGENKRTLFTLGNAYKRSGYFEKSLNIYSTLLGYVDRENSNYNKGIVRLYIAEAMYVLRKDKGKALKLLNQAEDFIKKSRWYRKTKVLKYIKHLRKQRFFKG
jgi:tetratricopeptide (TPR) repeat protein